jgi:hypothetical protein
MTEKMEKNVNAKESSRPIGNKSRVKIIKGDIAFYKI